MTKVKIIKKTVAYVKKELGQDKTGHDWWHIWRVFKIAAYIANKEKADLFIVKMAALLHDIADWKFKNYHSKKKEVENFLEKLNLDEKTTNQIKVIINNISFKGINIKSKINTKEGKIVQDADRLDVIGAIGIARVFATGALLTDRLIYNPKVSLAKISRNFIKKSSISSIHHFYDKVLLLKDIMNTKTGRKLAERRHKFLKNYLKEFFYEWNEFK